jgi:hypothetical protein
MTTYFFSNNLLGRLACCEAFDLLKVVDIVAGHGLYDGPEGHGAAFGVGGAAAAVVLRDCVEEEQVPVAGGLEESERGLEVVGCVAFGPGVLVEGLDDGEMGDDVADAPLAWGRGCIDLGAGETGGEGLKALGGGGEDGDGLLTVQIAGVRV